MKMLTRHEIETVLRERDIAVEMALVCLQRRAELSDFDASLALRLAKGERGEGLMKAARRSVFRHIDSLVEFAMCEATRILDAIPADGETL